MLSTQTKTVAICSVVLYVKFFITTMIQGGKTFAAGTRPPEDSGLIKSKDFPETQNYGLAPVDESDEATAKRLTKAREIEHRWRRLVLNDLENIPLPLIVFAMGALTDANVIVHIVAMSIFTASRIGHSFAYANEMQPYRAYFYMLAVGATFVGAGNAIYACIVN